jgi:hypothetical protein
MESMNDKLKKHKQDIDARKPKKDLLWMFKRLSDLSKKNQNISSAQSSSKFTADKRAKGSKKGK